MVSNLSIPYHKPRQIEFSRLGLTTVWRKLRRLVEDGVVSGWTTPDAHPAACAAGAIAPFYPEFLRAGGRHQVQQRGGVRLPGALPAEDLNATARRVMAVTRPIKLTITPEGKTETVTVENNPVEAGTSRWPSLRSPVDRGR